MILNCLCIMGLFDNLIKALHLLSRPPTNEYMKTYQVLCTFLVFYEAQYETMLYSPINFSLKNSAILEGKFKHWFFSQEMQREQ